MDIQQKVLSAFQAEHKEQVEGIRSILGSLRVEGGAPSDPRWNEAFRMAHTLKGGARVCELRGIESLGHNMESLFAGVREGTLQFDGDAADVIYRVLDDIEDGMAKLASSGVLPNVLAALEPLERLVAGDKTRAVVAPLPAEPDNLVDTQPPTTPVPAPAAAELETLRVRTQHLDAVLRSADALFELNSDHDHVTSELDRVLGNIRELQRECDRTSAAAAPSLRRLGTNPQFAQIERHVEYVTQQVRRIARQFRMARSAQQRAIWTTRVVSEELRRAARDSRMVSAEECLQGLRPLVRNLARDEGKEIEFTANGLNILSDRVVLRSLKDALLHALRNAVVHGIEPAQERVAAGKNPTGKITLTLSTHGNRLRVLVEDDGRGINFNLVAKMAGEQGILPPSDAPAAPEKLRQVLFKPGFTTSPVVSELAGRGMGLSVVHETVTRLRGSVRIGPRSGSGTLLEITVALGVSAERLLIVGCSDRIYAIPMHAVDRLLRLPKSNVHAIQGRRFAVVDEQPIPLTTLPGAAGDGAEKSHAEAETLQIVTVRDGDRRIGLIVDSFLGEREALIKELDGPAAAATQFCGAILLDSGDVALVIDPAALSDAADTTPIAESRMAARRIPRTARVLVVDDSFTTRTLEKGILETNGYDVRVAVDGVEALVKLRSELFDIVIADVQMPKMDGLSLLREIRADKRLQSLPLILVTSLDQQRDFERGMELGANAYIVKRKFDHQELLSTIQRFL